MPKRVCLSRRRGAKFPPGTVTVGRPGPWGNQFVVRPDLPLGAPIGSLYTAVQTAAQAVASYRQFLIDHPAIVELARRELAGKNLACWCALERPCHADVLLELANR